MAPEIGSAIYQKERGGKKWKDWKRNEKHEKVSSRIEIKKEVFFQPRPSI